MHLKKKPLDKDKDEYGNLFCDVYFADGDQMLVPGQDCDRFVMYTDKRKEMSGSCAAHDLDSQKTYTLNAHGRDLVFRGPSGNVFIWFKNTLTRRTVRVFVRDEDEEVDI